MKSDDIIMMKQNEMHRALPSRLNFDAWMIAQRLPYAMTRRDTRCVVTNRWCTMWLYFDIHC